jgi:hypothetical protein
MEHPPSMYDLTEEDCQMLEILNKQTEQSNG